MSSTDSSKKSLQTSTCDAEVRYNADLLPSPPGQSSLFKPSTRGLTHHRGSMLGMAALLRLLLGNNIQPQQLQPRCLSGIYRASLVARHDRGRHWIRHPHHFGRAKQPWCYQILHRLSSLRSSSSRCARRQLVHSCQGCGCYRLLRDTDLLRRPHHISFHARHLRQRTQQYPQSPSRKCWHYLARSIELLPVLDGTYFRKIF